MLWRRGGKKRKFIKYSVVNASNSRGLIRQGISVKNCIGGVYDGNCIMRTNKFGTFSYTEDVCKKIRA